MAMNRGEIRAEIVGNHGGITGKDTVIDTILNLLVKDMSTNHNWRDLQTVDFSQTLAADAYQITVPTTIQKIELINILDPSGNWYEVDPVPLQDFRKLEDGSGTPLPDPTSQKPTHAHLIGNALTFNRYADLAYTIYLDAFLWPTDMTVDADLPSITNADPIIITYGTAWLYQHRKQVQTSNIWFGMADMFYKSITNEDHGMKFEFTRKQLGI